MKKTLLFVMIGISIATLCSCGSKSVKGADGKEYSSYQEACRHQDFVAAYDWIEKNNGSDDDKDYVFNAEMLYLTSLGTEEASNRIVYLLAEYQIPGTPVQEETEYTDIDGEGRRIIEDGAKKYIEGIARFNKRCDNIIDIAITQNNKPLSEKVINLYKQDIDINWGSRDYHYGYYTGYYRWSSKEAARKKIDEAFGKESDLEESEEIEEQAPAKPTSKKKDNSKRRKR